MAGNISARPPSPPGKVRATTPDGADHRRRCRRSRISMPQGLAVFVLKAWSDVTDRVATPHRVLT